jgi:hypothetical protein
MEIYNRLDPYLQEKIDNYFLEDHKRKTKVMLFDLMYVTRYIDFVLECPKDIHMITTTKIMGKLFRRFTIRK